MCIHTAAMPYMLFSYCFQFRTVRSWSAKTRQKTLLRFNSAKHKRHKNTNPSAYVSPWKSYVTTTQNTCRCCCLVGWCLVFTNAAWRELDCFEDSYFYTTKRKVWLLFLQKQNIKSLDNWDGRSKVLSMFFTISKPEHEKHISWFIDSLSVCSLLNALQI